MNIRSLAVGLFALLALTGADPISISVNKPTYHMIEDWYPRPAAERYFVDIPYGYRQLLFPIPRAVRRSVHVNIVQLETSPSDGTIDPTTLAINHGPEVLMARRTVTQGEQFDVEFDPSPSYPLSFSAQYSPEGMLTDSSSQTFAVTLKNNSNLYNVLARKGVNINPFGPFPVYETLAPYFDPDTGFITLAPNEVLMLFETTHNTTSQFEDHEWDFNDLVLKLTIDGPVVEDFTIVDRIGDDVTWTDQNNGPQTFHDIWAGTEFLSATNITPERTMELSQVRWVGYPFQENIHMEWWSYRLDVWSSRDAMVASPFEGDIAQIFLDRPSFGPTPFGTNSRSPHGISYEMIFDLSGYHIRLNKDEDYVVGGTPYLIGLSDGLWKVSATDFLDTPDTPPDLYSIQGTIYNMNNWGAPPLVAFHVRGVPLSSNIQPAHKVPACFPGQC